MLESCDPIFNFKVNIKHCKFTNYIVIIYAVTHFLESVTAYPSALLSALPFPGCFLCWPTSTAIAGPGSRCSGSQSLARGSPQVNSLGTNKKSTITPTVRLTQGLELIDLDFRIEAPWLSG